MTALIVIGIYLVGYVVTYVMDKYMCDGLWRFAKPKEWTIRHRRNSLKLAVLSWFAVLCWVIAIIIEGLDALLKQISSEKNLDKPAKW